MPKILLGLGAFCLLVAAVIFLAVSWSVLGVGGRTAVLAALTLGFGGGSLALHRYGLRIAAESLSVVTLGMLTLDVLGAGAADWFGEVDGDTMAAIAGGLVAFAAAGLGALRLPGRPHLVAPQVIAGIAATIGYLGAVSATDQPLWTGQVVTVLAVLAVLAARALRLTPLAWSAAAAGALVGGLTLLAGLGISLEEPTLEHLWLDGPGWSLLASAALLLSPGLVLRHRVALLAGASGAAMVATGAATLPLVGEGATVVGVVTLAVTVAWAVALGAVRSDARVVAMAPAVTGCLLLVGQILTGAGVVLARWFDVLERIDGVAGADRSFGIRFQDPDQVVGPLVLAPAALVVVVVAALLLPRRHRGWLLSWAPSTALAVALASTLTLASYDVPVAAVALSLAAIGAAGALCGALRRAPESTALVVVGLAVCFAADLVALVDDAMILATGCVTLAAALTGALAGRGSASRVVAGIAVAPAILPVVAAATSLADLGGAWVAVPVLVAAGGIAVLLPRLELELSALGTSALALPVSLALADQPAALLALWLALLGALCGASALLHTARRPLGAAMPALWLLASWVWLVDLGVEAPEPYTLPAATVLLGAGLYRLRAVPTAGTAGALLPGLLLGTLPSLLWVFEDPLSLRALLLGIACLVLTLAGAVLRWSAPLVVGAAVGAAVVLRELGPYAGSVPQWVWIGLAGLILTVVGITWERQLLELRKAVGAIRRLR
ncbi:SCO7613 C-terminal domain-containing membrane protein [Nocardioides sambongensis]|uniref:SCO7613 C-terminal domain-containing membrane protein n=1 Tax=Nocardioides sambongensis TaxID=2589074 RepID=UPI0011297B22|nr:hypothetical protein [Nocardioides sambongensis]